MRDSAYEDIRNETQREREERRCTAPDCNEKQRKMKPGKGHGVQRALACVCLLLCGALWSSFILVHACVLPLLLYKGQPRIPFSLSPISASPSVSLAFDMNRICWRLRARPTGPGGAVSTLRSRLLLLLFLAPRLARLILELPSICFRGSFVHGTFLLSCLVAILFS